MNTLQPKVFLYNHTEQPRRAIALAVSAWASDHFYESEDQFSDQQAEELAKKGIKAFHRVALEYVDMTFIIKNVSRAFQQQLTRTRHASFSIQSMRMVTKSGFATGGHYTMPPGLDEEQQKLFHKNMLKIEEMYGNMIWHGNKVEDARGILPLNIHSDITMHINLNALYHMLQQRLCVNTQHEFRQVAAQIKALVREKLGDIFSEPIDAPCVRTRNCPMKDEFCGTSVWLLDEPTRVEFYKAFKPGEPSWNNKRSLPNECEHCLYAHNPDDCEWILIPLMNRQPCDRFEESY